MRFPDVSDRCGHARPGRRKIDRAARLPVVRILCACACIRLRADGNGRRMVRAKPADRIAIDLCRSCDIHPVRRARARKFRPFPHSASGRDLCPVCEIAAGREHDSRRDAARLLLGIAYRTLRHGSPGRCASLHCPHRRCRHRCRRTIRPWTGQGNSPRHHGDRKRQGAAESRVVDGKSAPDFRLHVSGHRALAGNAAHAGTADIARMGNTCPFLRRFCLRCRDRRSEVRCERAFPHDGSRIRHLGNLDLCRSRHRCNGSALSPEAAEFRHWFRISRIDKEKRLREDFLHRKPGSPARQLAATGTDTPLCHSRLVRDLPHDRALTFNRTRCG